MSQKEQTLCAEIKSSKAENAYGEYWKYKFVGYRIYLSQYAPQKVYVRKCLYCLKAKIRKVVNSVFWLSKVYIAPNRCVAKLLNSEQNATQAPHQYSIMVICVFRAFITGIAAYILKHLNKTSSCNMFV